LQFGIPANDNPFVAATADLFRISDGQIMEYLQVGEYSNFTEAVGFEQLESVYYKPQHFQLINLKLIIWFGGEKLGSSFGNRNGGLARAMA